MSTDPSVLVKALERVKAFIDRDKESGDADLWTDEYRELSEDIDQALTDYKAGAGLPGEVREACAKICDFIAINAERRAADHKANDGTTAMLAALDKAEAAKECRDKIRELNINQFLRLSAKGKEG